MIKKTPRLLITINLTIFPHHHQQSLFHCAILYNVHVMHKGWKDFETNAANWAIPENIHTIPRTAFRISEGEGGFTIMEF